MAEVSEEDRRFAKIVGCVRNVPADKLDQCLGELERDASGQQTLEKLLLRAKVLDADQAKRFRRWAAELAEAPNVQGYVMIRRLGAGGMGAVYQARQLSMARDVAIKVLPDRLAADPTFVERFYREARSSAKLDHPNVVRGYDVGESSGFHYFAMEFVDGKSVQHWLDKLGKLPVGDALKIALDVARALTQAEENHMVHRDIKPDNIMVTRKGIVKLADLGLAKQLDDNNSMTQTGAGFGTPYYMPVEQAVDAKHVDIRSDIYALGATLYRMVTGKVPYDGATAYDVLLRKKEARHPSANSQNPDVPSRLSLLIDKMLAKEPVYRPESAARLVAELENLGLHHESLSFIDLAMPHAAEPPAVVSPAAKTRDNRSSGTASASRTVPDEVAKPVRTSVEPPADWWFLRYHDARGKPVRTKVSPAHLRKLILQNQLDETVEGSRSQEGPFRRLATYEEWGSLFHAKQQQRRADFKGSATGNRMADLIENFDAETRRHKRRRKLADLGTWLWSLILTGVVVGGGCWGIYAYIIKPRFDEIQEHNRQQQRKLELENQQKSPLNRRV